MFFCRPKTHVDADLGNQAESGRFTNAIDLSQIHAADSKRFFSNIEFHLIASLSLGLASGFEDTVRLCLCFQTPDVFRNFLIAFGDLFLGSGQTPPKIASTQTGVPFGNRLQGLSQWLPYSRKFARVSSRPVSCNCVPHRQSPE